MALDKTQGVWRYTRRRDRFWIGLLTIGLLPWIAVDRWRSRRRLTSGRSRNGGLS